jgi:hypothetical protein
MLKSKNSNRISIIQNDIYERNGEIVKLSANDSILAVLQADR